MSELIITITRAERDWPATTRRTRVTGYGVGVHSMTSEHWAKRVEFVGRPRIEAAIRRKDLTVTEVHRPVEDDTVDLGPVYVTETHEGGEA